MKARALIIGNSHVASLVPVWRRCGERTVDLDFLAAPGVSLSRLVSIAHDTAVLRICRIPKVRKPTKPFIPDMAKKKGFLELETYPVILVYGLQLLTGLAGQNHAAPDKWFDLLEASNSGVSRRAWQEAARDFVRNTYHYRLVSQFPEALRGRIVCLPCPFPNNSLPRAHAAARCRRERVVEALEIMGAELKALGVRFSGLPAVLTDSSGYLTASEYMKDPIHLNLQGAQIVLSFITKMIAEAV